MPTTELKRRRGRPPGTGSYPERVQVYLTPEQVKEIRKIARRYEATDSQVGRLLIAEAIEARQKRGR